MIQTRILSLQQVNGRQIIQMGNSPRAYNQKQKHSLTPLPADPCYDCLSQWKNSNGEIFLAREVQLPESISLQGLKSRLQNRQNILPETSYVYPLSNCYFEQMNSMCSQQQRCTLTCIKPKNNLEKIFDQKRLAGMRFLSEQINLIINNISRGLKSLLELNQNCRNLRMGHIVLRENVYLIDPILIESDPFGYEPLGEYPAPQQIFQDKQILSRQSVMSMHIFSLGMIGLQLYHSPFNVKEVYQKYQKYGVIVNINMQKLNELIMNVSDGYLKAKLACMTSFNPQVRKNIFKFIQNEKTTNDKSRQIAKYLQQFKVASQFYAPLSPLNHNNSQVRQRQALKQVKSKQNIPISSINKHPHLQKQPKFAENFTQKPKVSINFVSKIHNSTIQPNQNNTTTVKKSLAFNTAPKRQVQNPPPQPKNISITQQTPLKIKKSHNFSTIKEVSQYDECASTSRVYVMQDISHNGKYQGQSFGGHRQGWGTFYFQEGSKYQGEWKDDQMHGYGKLYYPSGKLAYEGQWKYNQFSGTGKVFNDDPQYFEYPFDFTDFNQLGEEWVYYEGNLEQDQRQGKGCLVLSNGQSLYGDFLADKVHGAGQFLTLSGKVIHGIWNDSILERTFAE